MRDVDGYYSVISDGSLFSLGNLLNSLRFFQKRAKKNKNRRRAVTKEKVLPFFVVLLHRAELPG